MERQKCKIAKQPFLSGLSTGLTVSLNREPRFALVHAGSEQGFVPIAELTFLCRKKPADVHDEMDADKYEKLFSEQMLPNCQKNAVIVLDNASYHTRRVEPILTSWQKADVMKWIIDHGISVSDNLFKRELLHVVYINKDLKYVIDEMVPPYHYELNPIEMVWSQLKHL